PDVRTLVREALPALGSRSRQSFRDRRPGAEYLHRRRAPLMADVAAPTPRSRRPLIIGAVTVLIVVGAALVLPRLLGPSAPDVPSAAAEATTLVLEPAAEAGENPFTATITARELDTAVPLVAAVASRSVELTQQVSADAVTGTL